MLNSSGSGIKDALCYGLADLGFGPVGMVVLKAQGEKAAHGGIHAQGLLDSLLGRHRPINCRLVRLRDELMFQCGVATIQKMRPIHTDSRKQGNGHSSLVAPSTPFCVHFAYLLDNLLAIMSICDLHYVHEHRTPCRA
jgi:hypothetical protein